MKKKDINDLIYFDEDGCLKYREKLEKKMKKGRQGRSRETRLRRRNEKYYQRLTNKETNLKDQDYCKNCTSSIDLVIEDKTSSIICMNCGMIEQIWNTKEQGLTDPISKSKPYERVVHYQQRLSSVKGIDPKICKKDLKKIQIFLQDPRNKVFVGPDLSLVGWQAIKSAVKELKLNSVYSSRWVQIRSRLNFIDYVETANIPGDLENILKLRFIFVSEAFDRTILNNNPDKDLSRKNMLNLNYVIPQLIRLESEDLFREIARFFPQNRSEHQPASNNQRWKIIINYCSENFTKIYHYKSETIDLKWNYQPLLTEDILNYFLYYR